MMYPLKFQKVLDLFDNPEVVQVKANNGNDMIPAGALWTQTSKNDNKYWSGKLNLVKLLHQASVPPMPVSVESAMKKLAGLLTREGLEDFDLMLFVNQNRRPDRKDPSLNLFAKVGPKKQVAGGLDDDVPNV